MTLFIHVPRDATPETLWHMCLDYNWDDGFAFPQAIADHPNCDLAVALELFWLSNAISIYLGEVSNGAYNADWRCFCSSITQRILSGHYVQGATSFQVPLTKVQIYKYRKLGVPSLLLGGSWSV
ncbi:DUF4274 domain-containing protein [Lysobacter sp. Root604]|uniref:DUF4274 domain-containing protein n=1 Tax=Lysobacter sp. Root604 TaxID=1736568 RepID=UPI0009E88C69|nr:DUF4274 domain-containing protein [Lysobacter sp. Root604]